MEPEKGYGWSTDREVRGIYIPSATGTPGQFL